MRVSSIVRRARGLGVTGALVAAFVAAPVTAQDAGPTVDMPSYTFAPAELHVAPGTTVTWTNDSDVGHTVTADDGSFDSGDLEPGSVFSMEFDDPGSYPYYCLPHGSPGGHGMAAIIIVDPPDAG